MKKILTMGFLVILTTFACSAQSMFALSMQKALAGDSKAQNDVAAYYRQGVGVRQDCEQAAYWYRKSAQQNDPVGLYGLGQCYAVGCGVPQDYRMAANYISRSANMGVREAQRTLAYMYEYGLGVPKNAILAEHWAKKANR